MQDIEVPREAEVRMACSLDGNSYLSVSEPSTCKYIVLLRTPSLCAGLDLKSRLQRTTPDRAAENQEL